MPGVREGWAAVCGLVAVLALGVVFYGRQAGGSGLWFMIALAVHVPVALWLFVADGRRGPERTLTRPAGTGRAGGQALSAASTAAGLGPVTYAVDFA
ncbi:hypothetical protein OHA63_30610 [Streptomyces anulatus]|uniref:hypothetical protein n=1 Tax=Streptomyces anulatus TaxID=1892 RepID=UPI002E35F8A6|nr:hypothetical protein [Streptomyces anulatus]